ncbi:GxxExxY protein [Pedobacter petrophilus]|uniref:GxxExxY protein n=1 Tax=Pedobacter petrophilus TaxID=1908241 RepID=A0A7K0FZY9_9SPHI|nr:GxxExxY protein [Pedobacter petrophilus]MRX76740.1 GxxExxY protein [Pedobacter petrophilus]
MLLTRNYLKNLVYQVNGAAIEVHKTLGSGLLECTYHQCMVHELNTRKINFKSELVIPVNYKGLEIDAALRCDLLIEDCLVVELKSVDHIAPIHVAQLLTYMKLLSSPLGLMINFNCTHIFTEGQKTYVNETYESIY